MLLKAWTQLPVALPLRKLNNAFSVRRPSLPPVKKWVFDLLPLQPPKPHCSREETTL
jgi:hypothetical protein